MSPRQWLAVAALAAAAMTVAACGNSDGGTTKGETSLTVLAASSLTESFGDLAQRFESEHDGVNVTLAFDSSTTLATQVVDGAPGDVLATADATSMAIVTDADAAQSTPVRFATNTLVLVVPADNPAHIESLDDLANGQVDWLMCDPTAPCGRIAQAVLDGNGVDAQPASLEVDVKSVLAKITSGEADAGLVYATDATAAGDAVQTIPVPGADAEQAEYLVAAVSANPLADEWVQLVTGSEGQKLLGEAGFGPP